MSATRQPLVEARGAGYRFGADVALAGVDLAIDDGDRLVVLGPNGGGKTTLARLLLGLRRPSEGEVRWRVPRRGRRFGYVPQFPSFDRGFPLRVAEMVRLGRLGGRRPLRGWTSDDRAAVARRLAELDLEDLAAAHLSELSGGELKRALIARALVGEPDLLVLDEPAASLDEPSRRRLWQTVASLPAATAVVLVTHDLAPGTFVAGRAVLVDRGLSTVDLAGLHAHPLLCGHGHDGAPEDAR
jgi:zinc transport system ATP-binding protein